MKKMEKEKEKIYEEINSSYKGFDKKAKLEFLEKFDKKEEFLFNILYIIKAESLE